MRVLLSFLISFSALGNPFPSEIPAMDDYVEVVFESFENYMSQLERSSVITYQKNGCRDYAYHNFMKFQKKQIKICHKSIWKGPKLIETMIYQVEGFQEARLIVKRIGKDVKEWEINKFFNFEFPLPSSAEEYEFNFEFFNTYLRSTHTEDRSELHVDAGNGNWIQHFVETRSESEIKREYGCGVAECRRFLTRATKIDEGTYQVDYWLGDSPSRTIPLVFRKASYEGVIQGLEFGSAIIKNTLTGQFGFPQFE